MPSTPAPTSVKVRVASLFHAWVFFHLRLGHFYLRLVFVAYGGLFCLRLKFGLVFFAYAVRLKLRLVFFVCGGKSARSLLLTVSPHPEIELGIFFTYGSPTVSNKDEA